MATKMRIGVSLVALAVLLVAVTAAQDFLPNGVIPVSDGDGVEFTNSSLAHALRRSHCEELCWKTLRGLSVAKRQNCSDLCATAILNNTGLCGPNATSCAGNTTCGAVCRLVNSPVPVQNQNQTTNSSEATMDLGYNGDTYRELRVTCLSSSSLFLARLVPVNNQGKPTATPLYAIVRNTTFSFSTLQLQASTSYRLDIGGLSEGRVSNFSKGSYFSTDGVMNTFPALNTSGKIIAPTSTKPVRIRLSWSVLPGLNSSLLNDYGVHLSSNSSLCMNGAPALHTRLTAGTTSLEAPMVFPLGLDMNLYLLYGCTYDFRFTTRMNTASGGSVTHPTVSVKTGNPSLEIGELTEVTLRPSTQPNGEIRAALSYKLPTNVHFSVIKKVVVQYYLPNEAISIVTDIEDIFLNTTASFLYQWTKVVPDNTCLNVTMFTIPRSETPVFGRSLSRRVCLPPHGTSTPTVFPLPPAELKNLYGMRAWHVETTKTLDFPRIMVNWTQISDINATAFRIGLRAVDQSRYLSPCLANPYVFEGDVDANMSSASLPDVFTNYPQAPYPVYGCKFQVQLAYQVDGFAGWIHVQPQVVQSPYYAINTPQAVPSSQDYLARPDGNATVILSWLPPKTVPVSFVYSYSLYLTRVNAFSVFSQPLFIFPKATDTVATEYTVTIPWDKYGFKLGNSYSLTMYVSVYKRPVYVRSNRQLLSGRGVPFNYELPALPTTPPPPTTPTIPPTTIPPPPPDTTTSSIIIGVTLPVGVLIIAVAMYAWVRLNKQSKSKMTSLRTRATTESDHNARNLYQQNGGLDGINSDAIHGTLLTALPQDIDEWEIDPELMVIVDELGEGAFGKVYKALLYNGGKRMDATEKVPSSPTATAQQQQQQQQQQQDDKDKDTKEKDKDTKEKVQNTQVVAVKKLKSDYATPDMALFKAEINLMKDVGCHPNVLKMIGCCTHPDKVMLITEYANFNNLHCFLQHAKERKRQNADRGAYYNDGTHRPTVAITDENCLGQADLLNFGRQIAEGMHHLQSVKIIHRDLAARNVLVAENKILKISDFGLAKDVYLNEAYVQTTKGKLPFKWMAIEAIRDRRYTSSSDVWAYGVTLWECMTLGAHPYPTIANDSLLPHLEAGNRLQKPDGIDPDVFDFVAMCWSKNPDNRPLFSELALFFSQRIQTQLKRNYIDIG